MKIELLMIELVGTLRLQRETTSAFFERMHLLYPIQADHRIISVVNSRTTPHFVTSPQLLFDEILIANFSVDTFRPMVDDEFWYRELS
jgi:hypothetical protein